MARARLLTWTILLAAAVPAFSQELTPEEKKDGFVPLFNGKDLTGFRFSPEGKEPKNWKVADGMIRLSGGGSPHLATQWDYDDFEVRFEWRPAKKGYNSGFFVRSGRKVGANQINLAQKAAGTLMGGAKGGKAVPELQKEPGQWNEWRLRAVGDTLTFWCNGTKAWEVTGFKTPRGYLGWQAEGAAIDFRNFRIKEIGWEHLGDLKQWKDSEGWTMVGDAFSPGPKAKALVTPRKYENYILRLEYRDDAKPRTELLLGGGRPAILNMLGADFMKHAHPPGKWNHLEVTMKNKKGTVLLNGQTVFKDEATNETVPGPVVLIPGNERPAFRNIRIKELK